MISSDVVVKGEAIESDEEDDDDDDVNFDSTKLGKVYSKIQCLTNVSDEFKGVVYSGEAPESDDEILAFSNVSLSTAHEVTETFKPLPVKLTQRPPVNIKQSILQKILVDRNQSLWNHLNQCVQTTVVTASSQILAAEQLLVQSQMKIQAAHRTIKQANDTADQIQIKCKDILTSNFLPEINIPNS